MCGIAGFIDFSFEKSILEKIEFAEKKAAYFKEGIKKEAQTVKPHLFQLMVYCASLTLFWQ